VKVTVDELWRIVLPREARKQLDINERDVLEVSVQNDEIIIKKIEK